MAGKEQEREASLAFFFFAVLVSACAGWNLIHPKLADFRAYWFGIGTFLRHTKPLYGVTGGLGFPMIFRYPPAFVLLFYPFAKLPFRAAGALWIVLEWASLLAVTRWAFRRLSLSLTLRSAFCAIAIVTPYLFLSFKDGNAQWLATVLALSALLLAEERPGIAGLALATAVVVKVWPALFLPILMVPVRRKALGYVFVWSAVIWTAPAVFFGAHVYGHLLHEWATQELANHIGAKDIWYPSQSLRGLSLRLFTDPSVTLPYRSEFPDVHVASWSPQLVVLFSTVFSAGAFIAVLLGAWRAKRGSRYRWDALYFVAFSAFQPFCNRASLISVLPAILVAQEALARTDWKGRGIARLCWAGALVLACSELAFSPSRRDVKWIEALGLHFPLMLAIGVVVWLWAQHGMKSDRKPSEFPAQVKVGVQ